MGRILIPILVAVCFIGSAYGTECSAGPGYRFPINCPGESNSTKSYCCEIGGSFRCCDKEEFVSQEGRNDNANPPMLRVKRQYYWSSSVSSHVSTSYTTITTGVTTAVIIYIILGIAGPIALICCCCCLCCASSPCYAWCHPNHSTAVTIVQPSGYPGGSTQNNFSINVPTQPAMAQDLPPKYNEGGYTTPSPSTNPQQNYI